MPARFKQLFGNSADDYLKVHDEGPHYARDHPMP